MDSQLRIETAKAQDELMISGMPPRKRTSDLQSTVGLIAPVGLDWRPVRPRSITTRARRWRNVRSWG